MRTVSQPCIFMTRENMNIRLDYDVEYDSCRRRENWPPDQTCKLWTLVI